MPSTSRNKAKEKSKTQPSRPPSTSSPQWPPLNPLVPTSDLSLETALENQVILIRSLFTSTLCKSYVSYLSTLPLITTPARPKDGDAVRVNDRIEYNDYGFAEKLWRSTALETLVNGYSQEVGDVDGDHKPLTSYWGGDVIGLSPRIRIYRYKEGQFFAQHCK